MAKKPAKAKASDGEAIPEKPTHRTLKDGRVIPIFDPMPDGSVSPEEQAWADEEQKAIIAQRDARREEEAKAEREAVAAKEKRAAEKRADAKKLTDVVADLVKRVAVLESRA